MSRGIFVLNGCAFMEGHGLNTMVCIQKFLYKTQNLVISFH